MNILHNWYYKLTQNERDTAKVYFFIFGLGIVGVLSVVASIF